MHTTAKTGSAAVGKGIRAGFAILLMLASGTPALAQTPEACRLESLSPAGVRSYLTESWGTLGFALTNPTAEDLEARVLTFYAGDPARQYGRDVWIPAHARLASWFSMGPPLWQVDRNVVELKSLLYDRKRGQEHLNRSPEGQPLHSEIVRFARSEPGTAVMLDADIADASQAAVSPQDEVRAGEIRDLVRLFRQSAGLSTRVNSIKQRFLIPTPEALEGTDHFVLASDRIKDDIVGGQVLRGWLERGGALWILLDRVEPGTVATLLGNVLDYHVVDRTSLTRINVRNGPANPHRAEPQAVEVEEPVDFVRVLAPRHQVLYAIDGWPAAFLMEVGRGRILFTTLGPRGWMRPRLPSEPRSKIPEFPDLPVALTPLEFLAGELHLQRPERPPFTEEELRTQVAEQISYSVVKRATVFLVFGAFFLVLIGLTAALGRKLLLEHMGWLGPVLALGTAGVFIILGERSRSAVPPTVAVVQIADAVPGLNEVETSGSFAVYQPGLASTPIGAEKGGSFDLDLTGLEGRVLRRVRTDLDRWHLENLELPAGIRLASFRQTVRSREPVEATIRFGPQGAEGRVVPGPFQQLEDLLVSTPGAHTVAVRPATDGTFRLREADELQAGELVVGGLLTDRQRTHQRLYKRLLAEPQPRYIANRNLLLAWAEPVDMHFQLAAQARTTGSALLVVPLQFERTPRGTPVTIPGAFVYCQRISSDGRYLPPRMDSRLAASIHLRFQIPDSVLPLNVESARFTLQMVAPAREIEIGAFADGKVVPLRRLTSPHGVEQIEITDRRLLQPDDQGVVHVNVEVGDVHGGHAVQDQWRLDSVGLEIHGRTPDEGKSEHGSR